ncbi:MAG: sodium:solute symporter family protein [Myxococcota bacterium]|nr:sodium:solute symporter family protein [Myxococcota bacterium]
MDPFVYQYCIGGGVFLVGMIYAWRQGYVGLQGKALTNLGLMVAGFAFFMGLQAYLEYAPMEVAEPGTYTGAGLEKGRMGAPLDYGIMIAYFVAMLTIGTWFGRQQKDTKDFFFGGQRFSWWLISFSLIATTIGSYSFVKYSKIAYGYGIASSQTYLNDWFWIPLALFGWLPILYFQRLVSIPEYFERRFGSRERRIATWLLLLYLVGYVGINLFTMGKALNILLGVDIWLAAAGVAAISAVYVTSGGQTSVIMTDLFQGVMLLATGIILLWLGIDYLGGFDEFWTNLPRSHRRAFTNFNEDPSYNSVGLFWQDGMANTAMFVFLNQGLAMRLLSARSVDDGRKALITTAVVLMPIAALVVASGGWVAKALVHAGALPPDIPADKAFFIASDFLSQPGLFGLIMASLTAALMSTVDTLITAVAAIFVNDIYRPRVPNASDKQMLGVARMSSISVTLLGVFLVPLFMQFDSIYSAHGAFTAAVTPPLVVALLMGVFWKRFTAFAAFWTMVGGTLVIGLSVVWPQIIEPFAHGVPMVEVEEGFLSGKNQFKFMRAFFGLSVCTIIGLVAVPFSRAPDPNTLKGLVWGTVGDAIAHFKGKAGSETESDWVHTATAALDSDVLDDHTGLSNAQVSRPLAEAIQAEVGDLVYVTDPRWWLGGLKSSHVRISDIQEGPSVEGFSISLGPRVRERIGSAVDSTVRLKRLY